MTKRKMSLFLAFISFAFLAGAYCVSGGEAVDLNGENIVGMDGKIVEIVPYYENDKPLEDIYFLVMSLGKMETGEDNTVWFRVDSETQRVNGLEPAKGAIVRAYYDGSLPVILIYPPRYNAVAVEVLVDPEEDLTENVPATPLPPETSEAPDETQQNDPVPSVAVNGNVIDAEYVVNADGVITVPVRAVCEALGHEVRWDAGAKRVEIDNLYSFVIGKDSYNFARMAPFELGTPPAVSNGVTYVPLRFFNDVMRLDCAFVISGQVTIDSAEKNQ